MQQGWVKQFQNKSEQELVKKIDDILEDVPSAPTLELADKIFNVLDEVANVLQNDYMSDRVLNEKTIEDIKEEYNFDYIKNELDEGHLPASLDFFYGGENEHFQLSSDMLNLNINNSPFIDFICSEKGKQILNSNSLVIHIKIGNIFYHNFNTNKNFCHFLLPQQDETKIIIKKKKKKLQAYSFEKYIKSFLQEFDFGEIDKFDLHTNKTVKYIFYRYNSYLEVTHQTKQIIRQTKKVKNKVGLEKFKIKIGKIQQKKSLVILKITKNQTQLNKNSSKILQEIETNYKIYQRVYGMLFYDVAENFKNFLVLQILKKSRLFKKDITANSWGVLPIERYENEAKLLKSFNIFYYINQRFPMNGSLSIPDGDAPSFVQRTNNIYKKPLCTFRQNIL